MLRSTDNGTSPPVRREKSRACEDTFEHDLNGSKELLLFRTAKQQV